MKDNGDGTVTVGITDHAQEALGDIVFVEAPEVGTRGGCRRGLRRGRVGQGRLRHLRAPGGRGGRGQRGLADTPETINEEPYGDGWIFSLRLADPGAFGGLLDAAGYAGRWLDAEA